LENSSRGRLAREVLLKYLIELLYLFDVEEIKLHEHHVCVIATCLKQ